MTKKRLKEKISELEAQKKSVEGINLDLFPDWRVKHAVRAGKNVALLIATGKLSGMKEILNEM